MQVNEVTDVADVQTRHGVPQSARGCHTALVGGYVVEGHVPADVIRRLLKERPKVVGIAVPGMVTGTPGMDGPKRPYDVVAFDKAGKTTVFEKH